MKTLIAASFMLGSSLCTAGTVVWYTGDSTKPTASIEGFGYSLQPGTNVGINGVGATVHSSLGAHSWVTETHANFSHWFGVFLQDPRKPPIPTYQLGGAMVTGSDAWWFEYLPDDPSDIPVGSFAVTIQVRARGSVGTGAGGPTGASAYASVNGKATFWQSSCGGSLPPASHAAGPGSSWDVNAMDSILTPGLGFEQQPNGKWLGKVIMPNSSGTVAGFAFTAGMDSAGSGGVDYVRQMQVLTVIDPNTGFENFFNDPWL